MDLGVPESFTILSFFVCVSFAKQMQVYYEIASGSNAELICAAQALPNDNVAVKSLDDDGQCDVITDTLPESYPQGFTYLEKKSTVEIYDEKTEWKTYFKNLSSSREQVYGWNVPGKFGVGGQFGAYLKLPRGVSSLSFGILFTSSMLKDKSTFDIHTNASDVMFALVVTRQDNHLNILTFDGWPLFTIDISPDAIDVAFNVSIVATESYLEVHVANEIQLTNYNGHHISSILINTSDALLPIITKLVFHGI